MKHITIMAKANFFNRKPHKKLLLMLAGIALFCSSQGQIEIGAEGSFASFWLLNKNVSSAGGVESYVPAFSYNYGLHLDYDFTDNIGLVGNLLMGTYSQKYSGTFANAGITSSPGNYGYLPKETYNSNTTLSTMDIPMLLRFLTNSYSTIELGVNYSMLNSASWSATFSNPEGSNNANVKPYFASSNLQGVLGFGSNFALNDSWFIIADFRVEYGFADVKGVDGLGQDMSNASLYAGLNPFYSGGYQATHSLTGSLTIGIYYYIETNFGHASGHQKCRGPARVRS